jgi:hypothetical protein
MKTLFAGLIVGALAFAGGPTFAQENKSEPTKNETKKADVKKTDKSEKETAELAVKADAKKDQGNKKVKKGGC